MIGGCINGVILLCKGPRIFNCFSRQEYLQSLSTTLLRVAIVVVVSLIISSSDRGSVSQWKVSFVVLYFRLMTSYSHIGAHNSNYFPFSHVNYSATSVISLLPPSALGAKMRPHPHVNPVTFVAKMEILSMFPVRCEERLPFFVPCAFGNFLPCSHVCSSCVKYNFYSHRNKYTDNFYFSSNHFLVSLRLAFSFIIVL